MSAQGPRWMFCHSFRLSLKKAHVFASQRRKVGQLASWRPDAIQFGKAVMGGRKRRLRSATWARLRTVTLRNRGFRIVESKRVRSLSLNRRRPTASRRDDTIRWPYDCPGSPRPRPKLGRPKAYDEWKTREQSSPDGKYAAPSGH